MFFLLNRQYAAITILCSITIIIGMLISNWQIQSVISKLNRVSNISRNLTIRGSIVGLAINKQNYSIVNFLPDKTTNLPGIIRLNWHEPPELVPGDAWELTIKQRRAHNFSSYATFDTEAWHIRQNIYLRGRVITAKKISNSRKFQQVIAKIQLRLRNIITQYADEDTASILIALLIGDKSKITVATWEQLIASGTIHLVVISGLHIGLIAIFGFMLMKILAFMRLLPLNILPLPMISSIIAIILSLLYSCLAGFSIPVQRALIMTTLMLVSPLLKLRLQKTTQLLTAITIIHLFDPLCTSSQGFWLSFISVSALMLGTHSIRYEKSIFVKYLKPQIVVFCVLAPLLFYMEKPVSLVSPVVNLIAVPTIGFLVVPSLLLWAIISSITVLPVTWLLWFPSKVVHYFKQTINYLQEINNFTISFNFNDITTALLALFIALLLILPKGLRLTRLVPFFLLPIFFPNTTSTPNSIAKINVLDVGQGLAILIQTKSHTLVYDTGDKFSPTFSAAQQVIIPALHTHGVTKLDKIIISHADKDHSGGVEDLIAEYPAPIMSSAPLEISQPITTCMAGDSWQWDNVLFEILAGGNEKKTNDSSCILKVTASEEILLIPGDISGKKEKKLLKQLDLTANVLIAPHHGSKYSGSNDFLFAVSPSSIIISAGYLNKFNHPSDDFLTRANNLQINLYNTAIDGTVSFELGNLKSGYQCYRKTHKKYWHHD